MQHIKNQNTYPYRPLLLGYTNPEDVLTINALKNTATIIDTIENQLAELIKINNAGRPISIEELDIQKGILLNNTPLHQYGLWVYYPWNNCLVHVLPQNEFITVRTNRNKLKITQAEQDILASKKVGIIGLSVGQAVAITMAIERTCGELYLADFDTLDLSNLNRLRAGVHQIGLPKVIIAAREIAEIDPFIKTTIFSEGITDTNMETFLGDGDSKLDILVEVCDGLDIKIKARKAARSKHIPVIMDTNDKGMLDIERFDLEPNRPILHGLFDESIDISKLEASERIKVLMQIVSFENISERLKISMPEIGKTITTWPQLASSVAIGGGATCDIARKILLNQHHRSGRFYLDIDALLME